MIKETKEIHKNHLRIISTMFIRALIFSSLVIALEQRTLSAQDSSNKYFKIQVLDRQTGRGVPLGAFCHSSKSSICVSFARYSLAFSGLFQAS